MSDAPQTQDAQDESAASVEVVNEPGSEIGPEIAYVVPATVFDTIDTDDELARRPEGPVVDEVTTRTDPEAVVAAIRELDETVGRRLDLLQTAFEREIRAEATREKVVDRLHAELQEYKQDLLLQMLRPIFVDLIQLHDDIGKIIEAQSSAADGPLPRSVDAMRGFQQGIEDILYRQGVEPFDVEGETFDPRRQRAVATVPNDDPAVAKTVATRHRKGFRAGEKVIRPEVVSVYAAPRNSGS